MSGPTHIIRRQLVEVYLPSGADSRAVQDRVSRLCREMLTTVLDAHLSQHAGSADVQLARVELDLGTLTLVDLEQVLPRRLAQELHRVLPPAVLAPIVPAADPDQAGTGRAQPEKRAGKDTDLIAHFLRSGLLPWWATPVSSQRLAEAFGRAREQNAQALRQLLADVLEEPAATQRLFYSCQDSLLEQLLVLWLPAVAPQALRQLRAAVGGTEDALRSSASGRSAWWYGLYKTAAEAAAGQHEVSAIYRMLTRFMAAKEQGFSGLPLAVGPDVLELVARVFPHKKTISTASVTITLGISAPVPPQRPAFPPASEVPLGAAETAHQAALFSATGLSTPLAPLELGKAAAPGEDGVRPDIVNSMLEQPLSQQFPERADLPSASRSVPLGRAAAFSDSDKISIQNSGLVLLWPFLPRFFATIGLTKEGRFPDLAAATRACLLLQYLVEGTADDVFEASLPLNKLLCGIELAQPLQTAWDISPEEASAATNLLEAVIQNGPLWRNLSIEGFRQAFLQREGLLSTRDGHWLLQAARETHDIIIDRLPWAVRHIKLPWMEHLLFAEWQQV